MNPEPNRHRLDFVDALRGIAVCGTVIVHSGVWLRSQGPFWMRFCDYGGRGVQLFFILSAFTIFLSFETRKNEGWRSFFIRRFFRIAPMFYLLLALSFHYQWAYFSKYWLNLVAKVFFLDNFYPGWVNNGIVGVEWTIGVEMIFYALAPFLYYRTKNLAGALFLLMAGLSLRVLTTVPLPSSPIDWNLYRAFAFPQHFYAFAVGIVIFYLFPRWCAFGERERKNLSDGSLIFLIIILYYLFSGRTFFSYDLALDFALAFFFLFFASIHSRLRFLWVNPVTLFLGKISYSLYLWHIWVAARADALFSSFVSYGSLRCSIAEFLFSVLLSFATYNLVEKPFIKLGNRLALHIKRQFTSNGAL